MKLHPGKRSPFASGSRGGAGGRLVAACASLLLVCGLALALPSVARGDAIAPPCTGNATVCENQLPGTPQSVWDVDGSGDADIQGFSTQISVNVGETVQFKIDTTARAYKIEIYRLGYYQGNGARKQADVIPSATLPQVQPSCASDATTEIYDCGTWGVSASWSVPSTAVSGVYIARLIRTDNGHSSHIPFIVRNDASHSEVVFQTSDPTWQAYNTYGQSDFYQGLANGRAYKVSYNRPIITRGSTDGRDFLFSNEYPMIRYLEQNGYDVSYISGLDTDIRGKLLTNHKVFTSVGHDEYWSAGQRSSVEAARDAGVNLAFFSGNEVYWKTRWEASEDGTSTANRTLVCYKDTWANQQIDPLGPTSTWRDPRWGGNGKGPENALTGTLYMANSDDLPITVSAREGKLRLWRNTTLTNQALGSSTALAPHTIGYESDEDLDNGFRPAGLIDMSTTVGSTPQYLQDFGSTVAPGTTTHHLTLYKAPSGALVFGAGTIQWGWGIDADHDGTSGPADVRMRQATMNLLADMGARATTVASDLVPATASTDTVAPTAVITSPAAGTQIPQGAQVTVTGTATDGGGGVVAGIEVSVDGGSTWDPAVGTSSFTYSGILSGSGAQAIQVRATDDSGNIQKPATSLAVTSGCPCSMFGAILPGTPAVSDSSAVTLGTKFTSSADGFITGLRFYKGVGNNGPHVGTLYTGAGTALATVTFANETATGWQSANFASTVPISAGTVYIAAYSAPQGHYAGDNNYFSSRSHTAGTLTALGGPSNALNGVYASGSTFPTQSYQSTNYYIDAVYSPTDTTPLTAGSTTPLDGSSSVPGTVVPTAKFSRAVIASTIAMTLTDPTNALVPGATSYDPTSRVVSFNPTAPLTPGVAYTARLNASAPDVGTMAAPVVWSFIVAKAPAAPGVCPCTVFDDTDAPTAGPDSGNSVELGAAFTADRSGTITGVRFYKDPSNTGSHPVSLWTAGGSRLAQATVATETTSGWQEGDFATPVTITAGTVYVVSYRAPTGHYSYTPGGLGSAVDRSPLHLPANAGRYTYGTGAPSTSSSANYFVDPVFSPAADAPPQVVNIDPADNATSVPVGGSITATFNAPVQASATTVAVTDPTGTAVSGTVATESLGGAVTFVPSTPLVASTRYTVTVSGAVSAGGTPQSAPFISHFTTSGVASCPCTVFSSSAQPQIFDSGDAGPITVGLRFSAAVDGSVTGVRYYADAANTGSHTGTLYSSGGSSLARVTFPPIQAPGWQYATFDTPVSVTAGSAYTAAVFMPVGHYSVSPAFFGAPYVNAPLTGQMGLYAYGSDTLPTASYNNGNYFVDALFAVGTPTTPAPTVSAQTPADGTTGVAVTTSASAVFSRAIDATTLQFTVTGPGGSTVPGTVSYDAGTRTATFQPMSPLTNGSAYTALLSAEGATGTVMAAPASWSFTTAPAPAPTVSATTPAAGATGVSPAVMPSGVFSVPIDPSTLAFALSVQGGSAVPGTVTYDGTSRTATYTPATALSPSTTYSAVLAAKNTFGGAMTAPATWTFTTAAPAITVPTVTAVTPAGGATAVPTGSAVIGTFSVAMNPSTVAFTVSPAAGGTVAGSVTVDSTGKVATFKPSAALAFSTTYSVSLSGTSAAGAAMAVPMTWSFSTVAAPSPTVSGQTPAPGATGVSATVSAAGTFSIPVDPTTVAFTLTTAAGAAVAGTVTYSSTTRTATFKPTASLAAGITYTLSLAARTPAGGVMAAPAMWSFTTVPPPVPTLTARSPLAGATGVAVTASVTGTFSVAMDPTSLAFSVATGGGAAVTGVLTLNSTAKVATFKPTAPLAYGTTYSVSLAGRSAAGGVLVPVTWSFTTAPPPVPTVSSQSPASGAFFVSKTGSVSAKFSVPVTPSSIAMTLTNSQGALVAGTVTYNTTTNVATLNPSATLSGSTTYTVSLSATGVAGGVMISPVKWSFTTGL